MWATACLVCFYLDLKVLPNFPNYRVQNFPMSAYLGAWNTWITKSLTTQQNPTNTNSTAHWRWWGKCCQHEQCCGAAVIDGHCFAFISIYFPSLWLDWPAHVNGLLDLWFVLPLMYWQASNAPLAVIKPRLLLNKSTLAHASGVKHWGVWLKYH